ncbi:hypothetical protein [Caulobacter sp. DWR3-1-2]|uniref:hypothetical protein n=1 Tax=Caulobacter sp. DWR3-1-2 TaxID=2804647 RepID=UPI003CF9A71D
MAPHATADDMARKRSVALHLVPPHAAREGWANRPNSTPAEAIAAFLPHIGRWARSLQAVQGPSLEDIELRLTAEAAEKGPLHLLAILDGLTLDEARKALAVARERGL